ncbi:hypothetical protein SLEP1_g58763 [Rubroshorea leprosula]|uniref:Secreted protein n=1 Tax=Rubroshorea leprosula TaxID=152421 RepID=A0AAV5MRL1_9ROSI|nr:hypothetical protein SLEP1_g58763 [Rubroshorea leprosula]
MVVGTGSKAFLVVSFLPLSWLESCFSCKQHISCFSWSCLVEQDSSYTFFFNSLSFFFTKIFTQLFFMCA